MVLDMFWYFQLHINVCQSQQLAVVLVSLTTTHFYCAFVFELFVQKQLYLANTLGGVTDTLVVVPDLDSRKLSILLKINYDF
jgi:hypothetical protein